MIDFFSVWVGDVCGGLLASLIINAAIYLFIGLIGRMSFHTLTYLMFLYAAVFFTASYAWYWYVIFLIIALYYMVVSMSKYNNKET